MEGYLAYVALALWVLVLLAVLISAHFAQVAASELRQIHDHVKQMRTQLRQVRGLVEKHAPED
jgi:hypothetical protein